MKKGPPGRRRLSAQGSGTHSPDVRQTGTCKSICTLSRQTSRAPTQPLEPTSASAARQAENRDDGANRRGRAAEAPGSAVTGRPTPGPTRENGNKDRQAGDKPNSVPPRGWRPFIWAHSLPSGSSGQPGTRLARAAPRVPYLALLPVGFAVPRVSPRRAVRSYRTVSPLPEPSIALATEGHRRSVLCGTFPGLAPGGRYPPPCPAEFGLSSRPGVGRAAASPACRTYSIIRGSGNVSGTFFGTAEDALAVRRGHLCRVDPTARLLAAGERGTRAAEKWTVPRGFGIIAPRFGVGAWRWSP